MKQPVSQPAPPPFRRSYLSKEESFMYDREHRFPMEDTMNAARIEFTEKGVMHMASRRCDLLKISKTEAVLHINVQFKVPDEFYLDVPDARITRIGCRLMRTHANNTIHVRFLSQVSDRDLNRIFVFSSHPKHRDKVLDIRA